MSKNRTEEDKDRVAEISMDIMRIDTILKTDIFDETNMNHPLFPSATTELVICLNDLLQKCNEADIRVNFMEDIYITNEITDITDLVRNVRNAVCHISSETHRLSGMRMVFTFNTAYGKTQFRFGDTIINSDFDDDVCFFFGNLRIYLKRHIIRAFNEARKTLYSRYYDST